MHKCNDPSAFLETSSGAPYRDELGRINPLAKRSSNCVLNSLNAIGVSLYGVMEIGVVQGARSIILKIRSPDIKAIRANL